MPIPTTRTTAAHLAMTDGRMRELRAAWRVWADVVMPERTVTRMLTGGALAVAAAGALATGLGTQNAEAATVVLTREQLTELAAQQAAVQQQAMQAPPAVAPVAASPAAAAQAPTAVAPVTASPVAAVPAAQAAGPGPVQALPPEVQARLVPVQNAAPTQSAALAPGIGPVPGEAVGQLPEDVQARLVPLDAVSRPADLAGGREALEARKKLNEELYGGGKELTTVDSAIGAAGGLAGGLGLYYLTQNGSNSDVYSTLGGGVGNAGVLAALGYDDALGGLGGPIGQAAGQYAANSGVGGLESTLIGSGVSGLATPLLYGQGLDGQFLAASVGSGATNYLVGDAIGNVLEPGLAGYAGGVPGAAATSVAKLITGDPIDLGYDVARPVTKGAAQNAIMATVGGVGGAALGGVGGAAIDLLFGGKPDWGSTIGATAGMIAFGPIGGAVGGILGGLVGGLFRSTPDSPWEETEKALREQKYLLTYPFAGATEAMRNGTAPSDVRVTHTYDEMVKDVTIDLLPWVNEQHRLFASSYLPPPELSDPTAQAWQDWANFTRVANAADPENGLFAVPVGQAGVDMARYLDMRAVLREAMVTGAIDRAEQVALVDEAIDALGSEVLQEQWLATGSAGGSPQKDSSEEDSGEEDQGTTEGDSLALAAFGIPAAAQDDASPAAGALTAVDLRDSEGRAITRVQALMNRVNDPTVSPEVLQAALTELAGLGSDEWAYRAIMDELAPALLGGGEAAPVAAPGPEAAAGDPDGEGARLAAKAGVPGWVDALQAPAADGEAGAGWWDALTAQVPAYDEANLPSDEEVQLPAELRDLDSKRQEDIEFFAQYFIGPRLIADNDDEQTSELEQALADLRAQEGGQTDEARRQQWASGETQRRWAQLGIAASPDNARSGPAVQGQPTAAPSQGGAPVVYLVQPGQMPAQGASQGVLLA